MAPPSPGVRRVPALLTALSALVLLIAVLGLTGVLQAPSRTAPLTTPVGQGSTVDGSGVSGSHGADAGAGQSDGGASGAINASGAGAGATVARAESGSAGPAVDLANDRLTGATPEHLDVLAAPAGDGATPAPADPERVPASIDESGDASALPAESGEGRRAVYSINRQRVWLVETDRTVTRTYLVSGRLDRPGPGTYQVYSKSPTAISYDYTETMQYMIRFAHGETSALGFHDIPVLEDGAPAQTEAQLGQPLSAGCVRQAEDDAEFLWDWATVGTTVVVVP